MSEDKMMADKAMAEPEAMPATGGESNTLPMIALALIAGIVALGTGLVIRLNTKA